MGRCGDPKLTLDALKGYPMFVGVDLASASDLNAAAFIIVVGDVMYAVFRYWLPERSTRFQDDRYADQFIAWERAGQPDHHPGQPRPPPDDPRGHPRHGRGHNVAAFACDRFQADYIMGAVEERGHTAYSVAKTAAHVTRATDDLIARHQDPARLQHDANPITSWMAGNVVGRYDENDNVLPKKAQKGSKASIDGMDALINANAAQLAHESGSLGGGMKVEKPNPYLIRGLAGAD